MALLREQKKIVKLVFDCPEDLRHYSSGVTKRGLIKHFMTHSIFVGDREDDIKNLNHEKSSKRKRDIETLIESCETEQDRFIRPVIERSQVVDCNRLAQMGGMGLSAQTAQIPVVTNTHDDGYYATSKGTDLLNWLGFLTIALEKHSSVVLFLTGSVVSGIIGWVIGSTPAWICYVPKIDSVLTWCHI